MALSRVTFFIVALLAGAAVQAQAGLTKAKSDACGFCEEASECNTFQACSCQDLANVGLLPQGVVGMEVTGAKAAELRGTCGDSIAIKQVTMKFGVFGTTKWTASKPIIASIVTSKAGAATYMYKPDTTGASIKVAGDCSHIICYMPTRGAPNVVKTANFECRPATTSTTWNLRKTVALANSTSNTVTMFNGDEMDATWTLSVTKQGGNRLWAGTLSGTITINNPTTTPIQVTSVYDQVQGGGPMATVTCPNGSPLGVPACGAVTCTYTADYPTIPNPGTYTNVAQVTYTAPGNPSLPGTAFGSANFAVKPEGPAPVAGSATVTDSQSPASPYTFTSSGSVAYTTTLACPATGTTCNVATITASGGSNSVSTCVGKVCNRLSVRLATQAAQATGRYNWTVTKVCTPQQVSPHATSPEFDIIYQPQAPYPAPAPGPYSGPVPSGYQSAKLGSYQPTKVSAPKGRRLQGTTTLAEKLAKLKAYEAAKAQMKADKKTFFPSVISSPTPTPPSPTAVTPSPRVESTVVVMPPPFVVTPELAAAAPVPYYPAEAGCATSMCSVTFTRTNPAGFQEGAPAYANQGTVYIENTASINAPLAYVQVALSRNGLVARLNATCDSLLVPAGGRIQCTYTARNLPFDPLGATAVATAFLANTRNGNPSGKTTPFTSPAIVVGTGSTAGRRKLQQTPGMFGGPGAAPTPVNVGTGTVNAPSPVVIGTGTVTAPVVIMPASNVGVTPTDIQDQCADVSDRWSSPDDASALPRVVAGALPRGRICKSMNFKYVVQWGPFTDCRTRRATNLATVMPVNSKAARSASTTVVITPVGCNSPAKALMLRVAGVQASSTASFKWAMAMAASPAALQLPRGKAGNVKFTVAYTRTAGSPTGSLSGTVMLANPATLPVALARVTYVVEQGCGTKTGTVSCPSNVVPPASAAAGPGQLTCTFAGAVACAGPGTVRVTVAAADGVAVTGVPTPFTAAEGAVAQGACANVAEGFVSGGNSVPGKLVSGATPRGTICGSRTFTYEVAYGPWPISSCAPREARRAAGLSGPGVQEAGKQVAVPILLAGCAVPTQKDAVTGNEVAVTMPGMVSCTAAASYWSACLAAPTVPAKCFAGFSKLGGKMQDAPFLKSGLTYAQVLGSQDGGVWSSAAKAYAAADLNGKSGSQMPSAVKSAFNTVGSFLMTAAGPKAAISQEQAGVAAAATQVLKDFSLGKYQATAPSC